jgi:hypothetical protein
MTTTAVTPVRSQGRSVTRGQVGCVLAAPLVALVARALMTPWYQDESDQPDSARYLAELAESPVRNEIGAGLTFLSAVLFAGAALVLTGIVRKRMPRLGAAGGALTVIGAFGLVTVSVQTMASAQIARFGEADTMIPLMDELYSAPQMSSFYVAMIAGAVGAVLLAVGLYRSQVVPRAAAILTGLGIAAVLLTAPGPAVAFIVGAAIIATVGMAWTAVSLWSRRPA